MSRAPELSDPEKHKAGNLVFFDFLGTVVIRWPELVGTGINLLGAALSVFSVMKNMQTSTRYMHRSEFLRQLGRSVIIMVATWLASLLVALVVAATLSALGRTMSWYSRPVWIMFLYACPMFVSTMTVLLLASRGQHKVISCPWTLFQLYYDAVQLLWTGVLLLCAAFTVRSGFIALLWVIFPSVGNLFRRTIFHHWRDWRWLLFLVAVLLVPMTLSMYLVIGSMNLYVPIMGRAGSGNNAEIIVGILTTTKFLLLFSYLVPIILLIRSPQKVISLLIAMFLIPVGLLILTPLGFPYSGDVKSPTPQRFMIAHTTQTFHDPMGKVRHHDSGYWIVDMDQNSPHSVDSLVPEMTAATEVDCSHELFCGMPYLMPVLTFIWKTHWIPGPEPKIPTAATLTLLSSHTREGNTRRLTFSITGPDHLGFMLSPMPGSALIAWSLVDGLPLASSTKWNGRDTYFVYYSCASELKPWEFWVDLKVPQANQSVVDVALTSHYLHGAHQTSDNFRHFVSQFPPWTAVNAWTATYTSWKF